MNPLKFQYSKVDKDPQEFIDGFKKITEIIGVTLVESVEQAAYHLMVVAHIWYKQWKQDRVFDEALVDWENIKATFLTCSFHLS